MNDNGLGHFSREVIRPVGHLDVIQSSLGLLNKVRDMWIQQ